LRPTPPDENGNIGFERKDGVFKEFCKKALQIPTTKSKRQLLLEDLLSSSLTQEEKIKRIKTSSEKDGIKGVLYKAIGLTKTGIEQKKLLNSTGQFDAVDKEVLSEFFEWKKIQPTFSKDSKFVFIIDEINRGEISKIFGELFFSIDPSYRGVKEEVQTQYQNLVTKKDKDGNDDPFFKGFFVPENVYIIGTMNDIDRSVESFDFAMRRRFIWEEITAEQSAENMNLPEDAKKRMKSLNEAISKIEGLNSSYHIGGAYFLDKDGKERTDYAEIWEQRLRPLLFEYLRGMSDAENQLNKLKHAYDNAWQAGTTDTSNEDENNGQQL